MSDAGTPTVRGSARDAPKRKVIIVGGGCAGLSAAWQLSKVGGNKPKYEIHLYEDSWRLGGKGASGRLVDGRIVEHGLHVWLGFYENAFRMMRECYAEVGRHAGQRDPDFLKLAHQTFEDAFFPEPHIGVGGSSRSGQWQVWSGFLPPIEGQPGTPLDVRSNPFTLANYLLRCLHLLKTLMLSVVGPADAGSPRRSRPDERAEADEKADLDFAADPTRSPGVVIERMARLLKGTLLTSAAGFHQAVTLFEDWLHTLRFGADAPDTALNFLEALTAQTRKLLGDFAAVDEVTRIKTEIIDIVMTIAAGLYRDRILLDRDGLDALNDIDYRDWLTKHGASRQAVKSRFLTGIYDLVFAYEGGDRQRPRLAAGVALRGALRMFFTYRGAMFWRMRSGMGDTVFAPLYEVLSRRNVQFHFRHRLTGIEMDGGRATALKFKTPEDAAHSDVKLDAAGGWPAQDELVDRTRDRVVDARAHAVILAIGKDDLWPRRSDPRMIDFSAMLKRLPHADEMHRKIGTVATRTAQVWLDRPLDGLGWHRGPVIVSAMDPPFETWADMTHTLEPEERWRRKSLASASASRSEARAVAYFCAVARDDARNKLDIDKELRAFASRVWPLAFHDAAGRPTERVPQLFEHQQLNRDGSQRYTQSLPGSLACRPSPLAQHRHFDNLTLAGDWTACGLDAGCIESAIMSGMLAARAVTGNFPSLDSIVGFDHP